MIQRLRNLISKFSVKVFLSLFICLLLPMYGMFGYMKLSFEHYIQEDLSKKIIQTISKSEQEIYKAFQNMANISSVLLLDSKLVETLGDPQEDYYEKTVMFDAAVRNITVNNLFTMDDIKITFLDTSGKLYSNWGLNYNDYSFIRNQDWVKESVGKKGHIVWSMFSPGYVIEPSGKEEKYISLARSMLSDDMSGDLVGTVIISVGQNQFSRLLNQYSYAESDCSFVAMDNGEILLKNDSGREISEAHFKDVLSTMGGNRHGSLRDDFGGKQYLVSYYTISQPWTFDGQRLRVLHYTDYQEVIGQMNELSRQINFSMMVFIGVLMLLIGFISSRIVKPVRVLAHHMQMYSINNELNGLDMERKDEIGHLNRAFLHMSERIRELFSKLAHEHEVREKYQYEALRAQVNPHFLFNTFTMIRWMAVVRRAGNIVESIDALATMMKYSMSRGGELVSLQEELDNIRSYVFIQNCRFGDRYQVKIQVDEELLSLQVIKFILQPVVENAVIHGFSEEKGIIWIYGELENSTLKLYVEDNGRGIPPDIVERFNQEKKQHRNEKKLTGIGLANVDERIRVEYGEEYGINIESKEGRGTTVTYLLPIVRGGEQIEKSYDC